MKNETFTIVDKIGEDNVIAFRNKTSVALDTSGKKLTFSDFTYSFEEVLSIAKKIEQIQAAL
jgi:hypothetical protein|tara:strand:- start:271 stop:456 length:186 start_codon:yes stop_codon:yes gene_type:complete